MLAKTRYEQPVAFSFQSDSKLLIERSESEQKVSLNLTGTRAERMAQFINLQSQKANEIQVLGA